MEFGRWSPLAEAAAVAPTTGGVFQVRIARGLIDYPTGKSAMIHYQAADNLAEAVSAFADRHRGEPWLLRVPIRQTPGEAADPAASARGLIDTFRRRFGAPPALPRR